MGTTTTSDNVDVRGNILATGQRIMAGKGFSAVGLNEILATAGVPKGSFYHYFGSKDAFGEAMLEAYFEDYLADMDATLGQSGLTMAQRLMNYGRRGRTRSRSTIARASAWPSSWAPRWRTCPRRCACR